MLYFHHGSNPPKNVSFYLHLLFDLRVPIPHVTQERDPGREVRDLGLSGNGERNIRD